MNAIPLAERIRPKSLDQFYGQTHLLGKNGVIRNIIKNNSYPSMIFWGPPGTVIFSEQILMIESVNLFF